MTGTTPPEGAAAESLFALGASVEAFGLINAAELNSRRGIVVAFDEPTDGVPRVKIDFGAPYGFKSVRPANLRPVDDAGVRSNAGCGGEGGARPPTSAGGAGGLRHRGTLCDWRNAKGFGFIQPEKGGSSVFVHKRELPARENPAPGNVFSYGLRYGERGAYCVECRREEWAPAIGARVTAHGLKAAAELNGVNGTIIAMPRDSDRAVVRFSVPHGEKSVRVANLRVAPRDDAAEWLRIAASGRSVLAQHGITAPDLDVRCASCNALCIRYFKGGGGKLVKCLASKVFENLTRRPGACPDCGREFGRVYMWHGDEPALKMLEGKFTRHDF